MKINKWNINTQPSIVTFNELNETAIREEFYENEYSRTKQISKFRFFVLQI